MRIQKVYVDTSVIGGCFDPEFKTWSCALFQDFKKRNFIPVVSEITAAEIEDAPLSVRKQYQTLLDFDCVVLSVDEYVIELAEVYQKRKILTPKYFDDGLHIAIATINKIDILVSWNFKHIVHYDKIRLFNAVNLEIGYKPIEIYSPMEVATYGKGN